MNPWELHPLLVHFPIAYLLGGAFLDLVTVVYRYTVERRSRAMLPGSCWPAFVLAGWRQRPG